MNKEVSDILYDAFESTGATAHDLGLEGLVAIINKWEEIRSFANHERLCRELSLFLHQDRKDNA